MRERIKSLGIILGVSVLIAALATPIHAQTTTLRLGHVVAEDHPQNVWSVKFAERVAQKTGGRLKIEIFPNAQLGSELQITEGVKLGTIDMVNAGAGTIFSTFLSPMGVFDIPFVFRDTDHLYQVQDGPIGEELRKKLEEQGFVQVGWSDIGWRDFTSNARPYRTPQDMKGLKVRVPNSTVYIEMVKALGGNPVPVPYAELYLALQQGVVDGEENAPSSIRAGKFYEVQKYLNLDQHIPVTCVVAVSSRSFAKLPKEFQQTLLDAGREVTKTMRPWVRQYEQDSVQFLKSRGMQVVEVDRAAFAEATKGVPDALKNLIPPDLVKRVRETR